MSEPMSGADKEPATGAGATGAAATGAGATGARSTEAGGAGRRVPLAWLRRRLAAMDLSKLLRVSAVLTLLALGLMVWSMLQPTPLPVMLAMSVGQGLGTLAFALYGYAVIADVRRARRARRARDAAEEPR